MKPGACALARVGDRRERVERAGVHLSGLGADDRRAAAVLERSRERVRAQSSLLVRLDRGRRPEPEQPQRADDGHVSLLADEHPHGRRTREPIAVHVPAGCAQHVEPRGGEPGHVRHLRTRDIADRRVRGQPEDLDEPFVHHLLGHRGGRAGHVEPRVLVPGRGEPVRREGGRQGAADHEAEVAAAANGDGARLGRGRELPHDLRGIERLLGQRPAERVAQLLRGHVREHRPLAEGLHVVGRKLCREPQQVTYLAHALTLAVARQYHRS